MQLLASEFVPPDLVAGDGFAVDGFAVHGFAYGLEDRQTHGGW